MAFWDVKCRAVIVPRKEYLSDIYKLQRANWSKTSSPWWQERALIKAWLSCDSSVRSGRHKYTKLHHTMYWFAMIISICVFWLSSNKLWPSSFSRPCCAHSELHSAIWCQFSLIAIFMGPTWGHPGSCRPRLAPCWPYEPGYQGCVWKLWRDVCMINVPQNCLAFRTAHGENI